MAMQVPDGTGAIIEGINVTPLVDITLVLLIVFMVTARFVVTPAVPLDLPQASHSQHVQAVLTISLTATGEVWIDGQPASLRALAPAAQRALKADPQTRAVIQAERRAHHGDVMQVLDALRGAGMERVAFAAAPPPPGVVQPATVADE